MLDDQYIKNRKAFVHVLAAFRYGREDLDVLGLSFRKDLFLASAQLYPPPQTSFGDLPTNPVPIIAVASCGGPNKKKSVIGLDEDDGEDRQPVTEKTAGRPLSRLQERLIKKLGPNAYPFYFEVSKWTPFTFILSVIRRFQITLFQILNSLIFDCKTDILKRCHWCHQHHYSEFEIIRHFILDGLSRLSMH